MRDWKLFAACVSNLCGGIPFNLTQMCGIPQHEGSAIMAGEPCNEIRFNQLLHQLGLKPSDFLLRA